jgi:predicted glycosyltransferase
MIVYYAAGGGLGHITRARRVLDVLQIDDAVIVASVPADERVTGRYPVVSSLDGLAPERIIADAFPLGLFGELADVGVPMDYVARLLKWDEYRRCVPYPLPTFGTTYLVEEVNHEVPCERIVELTLPRRDGAVPAVETTALPYWLVVHSGPEAEVRELIAYAEELQRIENDKSEIVVVSQCGIGLDLIPASSLFAGAAKIVSAAGFNVMLETEPYRDKHHAVPMPRRFDDQFARAARRRYSSSRICAAR